MPNPEPCLQRGCKKPGSRRGLCDAHYMVCWRLVRAGAATWDALVDRRIVRGESVGAARRNILRRLGGRT